MKNFVRKKKETNFQNGQKISARARWGEQTTRERPFKFKLSRVQL